MPYEPPWLNVNPSGLAEASARGSQLRLQRQKMAQDATDAAGQRAVEMARIDTERQIQQQKVDLDTQLAARKFAAQQQYSQLVQQGMDPIEAMLHVGPAMSGGAETGLGTMAAAQARMQQMGAKPQPVIDPTTGKLVGYSGGNMRFIPRPGAVARMNPTDYYTTEDKTTEVKGVPGAAATPSSGGPSMGGWNPFYTPGTPAQPPIPGIPGQTITRRIPVAGAGSSAKPSDKAIQYLIAHPEVKDQFDAKYPDYPSDQYLGGQNAEDQDTQQ